MPADRKPSYKQRKQPQAGPSTAQGSARPAPAHKIRPTEQRSVSALPGVNKIKGQIRQTKRLLAKDDLEPGLRVSTQRRLASLEADLANASKREVEKKNGGKYHMVKFFERQKLLRLVKRAKKTLANDEKSEKKRRKAEQDLEDARIMLNYIIHYPNTQKYIALFPSSKIQSDSSVSASANPNANAEESEGKLTLPPLLHPSSSSSSTEDLDGPSKKRLTLLQETKKLMGQGKFSTTPEDDVVGKVVSGPELGAMGEVKGESGESASRKGKAGKDDKEEKDDFFEEDDE